MAAVAAVPITFRSHVVNFLIAHGLFTAHLTTLLTAYILAGFAQAILIFYHARFRHTAYSAMLIRLFLLLAAVAPYAFADVEFTSPSAAATLQGGSTVKVAWKDSGTKPALSDLQGYQLFLCAGGNDGQSFVCAQ